MAGTKFNAAICSVLGGVSALAGAGALTLCGQRSCGSCLGCVGAAATLGVALITKKLMKKGRIKSEIGKLEVSP